MAEDSKKPVDIDREAKAAPLEAAPPVEVPAIMGATFAERAKASGKQVAADDTEDKAVKSSTTKSRAKKKA